MNTINDDEVQNEVGLEHFTPNDKLIFFDYLMTEENVR